LQDGDNIVQSCVAVVKLLLSGTRIRWKIEQGCTKRIGYLSDFLEDYGTMGEDNENGFVYCGVCLYVKKGLIDFSCVHLPLAKL